MKCPKCDFDIDEKMLVCPNCKKVLKLVCPKCKTINKGNLCKKCGFTIISRCHQCGKINQTINGKCLKCGFSTYKSVAINTSNIDDFACLVIEFPNLNDLKSVFGSTKLSDKFKSNLEHLMFNYVTESELTRELIDGAYVIKLNKDESFSKSAEHAINAAIEILNLVTELNFKLDSAKNTLLECKIAVLKRDINSIPEDFKSGFDVKLLNQDKKSSKLIKSLQVITDSSIYEQVCDNFNLNSLSSTFIKNKMVTFFELSLKKYIKIPKKEEKKDETFDLPYLPSFDDDSSQELNDLYNVDAINFDELKFNFINTDSLNILSQILNRLRDSSLSLVSVRAGYNLVPKTQNLLSEIGKLKKYKHVFSVACHDGMKYEPYGFLKELISNICNFSKAPKNFSLHSFEMFKSIDPSNYMQNLMNSKIRGNSIPETSRYSLFDIFFNVFSSIKNSIIVIEGFDKIDDSSYEILQLFFEKFDEFKVSYVTISSRDFSLHRNSHFLLSNPYYTEIIVKGASLKDIVAKNPSRYKNIVNSFYIKKIAQHLKGSYLYFEHSIRYLIDNEIFEVSKDDTLVENTQNSIFVPTNLDDLIVKELNFLSKEENAYKLLMMLLFIGSRIDYGTINLLAVPDANNELQKLIDKKIIYKHEGSVFINNYNLYKNNFLSSMNKKIKHQIAQELLDKIYTQQAPTSVEPLLYNILDNKEGEFAAWQRLAELDNSLGDFSAYLNCSNKFLKIADMDFGNSENDYKKEVYENISNLMFDYSPEKLQGILQEILNNFEKSEDDEKMIELCNKMLQGYLLTGSYKQALEAIRKIIASFPKLSINPKEQNFNIAFFFMALIKIEILFSLGNFEDCLEASKEVLDVIDIESLSSLKPSYLEQHKFENIIFDALCFTALAKIVLLHGDMDDFLKTIESKMGKIPEFFGLFTLLQDTIHGFKIDNIPKPSVSEGDRFSNILINLLTAFNINITDYEKFARDIHKAKVSAKSYKLSQVELACDLLIGYSYFKLGRNKKAALIFNNVLETSEKSGLKFISQLSWYLTSMLKYGEGSLDIAREMTNNAVVKIEKDENSSDFIFFLFKILLSKILLENKEIQLAKLCLVNAQLVQDKYGLNFDIKLDFPDLEAEVQTEILSVKDETVNDLTNNQPVETIAESDNIENTVEIKDGSTDE